MEIPYMNYFNLESSYRTNQNIQLDVVADNENWVPSDYIIELVKNFNDTHIELITSESTFKNINNDLRNSDRVVGLIILGENLLHEKPYLILLTTKIKIYAFDPNFMKGMAFLKLKLEDNRIQYWLTNTVDETGCFLNQLNIDLSDKKHVKSCEAVHINIMETIKKLPGPARQLYSPQARLEATRQIKIPDFGKLVEIYLDIRGDEIFYDKNKLPHLSSRPLNLTAINLIKKRCILVRNLAKALLAANQIELRAMHRIIYGRLLDCMDKPTKKIIKDDMRRCKERGVVDTGYFVHLSGGFNLIQDLDLETNSTSTADIENRRNNTEMRL